MALDFASDRNGGQLRVGVDRDKGGPSIPIWTGPELATSRDDRNMIVDGLIGTEVMIEVGARRGLGEGIGAGILAFAGMRGLRALMDELLPRI